MIEKDLSTTKADEPHACSREIHLLKASRLHLNQPSLDISDLHAAQVNTYDVTYLFLVLIHQLNLLVVADHRLPGLFN